jgi:hypothetical protein
VELEVLENDLSELIHILHTAERSTVKEVIHIDMELILTKIESLKNIFNPLNAELNLIHHLLALLGDHPILHVSRVRVKEQFETKVSWTKVATMNHRKYNYKEQRVEDTFAVYPVVISFCVMTPKVKIPQ